MNAFFVEDFRRSKYGPPHSFGMIWFDIEGPQYWGARDNNIAFIQGLINEAESLGLHVGIYTSESQWEPITGNWAGGARYPLWYAHYDNSPSFGDFRYVIAMSSSSRNSFGLLQSICWLVQAVHQAVRWKRYDLRRRCGQELVLDSNQAADVHEYGVWSAGGTECKRHAARYSARPTDC